jgi:hypothetical protein
LAENRNLNESCTQPERSYHVPKIRRMLGISGPVLGMIYKSMRNECCVGLEVFLLDDSTVGVSAGAAWSPAGESLNENGLR